MPFKVILQTFGNLKNPEMNVPDPPALGTPLQEFGCWWARVHALDVEVRATDIFTTPQIDYDFTGVIPRGHSIYADGVLIDFSGGVGGYKDIFRPGILGVVGGYDWQSAASGVPPPALEYSYRFAWLQRVSGISPGGILNDKSSPFHFSGSVIPPSGPLDFSNDINAFSPFRVCGTLTLTAHDFVHEADYEHEMTLYNDPSQSGTININVTMEPSLWLGYDGMYDTGDGSPV